MEEAAEIRARLEQIFSHEPHDPDSIPQLLIPRSYPEQNWQSYKQNLKQKLFTSACATTYSDRRLWGRCLTCQTTPSAGLCLECFIKGGHEEHKSFLCRENCGSCDCGSCLLRDDSYRCAIHTHHHDNDGSINQLTQEEITHFVLVFYETLSFGQRKMSEGTVAKDVFSSVVKMIGIGDAVRRCAVIAIQQGIDIIDMIRSAFHLNSEKLGLVCELVLSLLNDQMFAYGFAKQISNSITDLLDMMKTISALQKMLKDDRGEYLKSLVSFSVEFNGFDILIRTKQIDWFKVAFDVLEWLFAGIRGNVGYKHLVQYGCEWIIGYVATLAKHGLANEPERMDEFCERLFDAVSEIEPLFIDSRCFGKKYDETTMKAKAASLIHSEFMDLLCTIDHQASESLMTRLARQVSERKPECISILSQGNEIPVIYVSHMLASRARVWKSTELCPILEACGVSACDLATTPLRWAATSCLSCWNLFVRNPTSFIYSTKSYFFMLNKLYAALPTFAFIQNMLGVSEDKQQFLMDVGSVFGLFEREECDSDDPTVSNIEFTCLFFVLCLLFDRTCINNDIRTMWKMTVMTLVLEEGNITSETLMRRIGQETYYNPEFKEDLSTYTSLTRSRAESFITLKEPEEWHPLLPFVKLQSILDVISKHEAANKDSMFPFPAFKPEPEGIDIASALKTPFMFGFCFYILSGYCANNGRVSKVSAVLVLHFLSQVVKMFDDLMKPGTVEAQDLGELACVMPVSLIATVKLGDQEPASLLDLIRKCGDIGKHALKEMNIEDSVDESPKDDKETARRRALALKSSMREKFKSQGDIFMNNLELSEEEEEEAEQVCPVCQSTKPDIFVYPIFSFNTVLPDLVQRTINKEPLQPFRTKYVGIHMCSHAMHASCVPSGVHYMCPVDRCTRNGVIPANESEHCTNPELIDADMKFITKVFAGENWAHQAVSSLAGQLNLLEIRMRMNPDVADKTLNNLIFRVIFMLIRRRYLRDMTVESFTDPTARLLITLLNSPTLPCTTAEFLPLVESITGIERPSEFSRRASLIHRFILRISEPFPLTDEPLPCYEFPPHPKNFLHFSLPPHSVDMSRTTVKSYVSILTGDIIHCSGFMGRGICDHVKKYIANTFGVFVCLAGPLVSGTVIAKSDNNTCVMLKSIYLDKNGDPDVGLNRGEILYSSEEAEKSVIETVLSSEWCDCIEFESLQETEMISVD